ncbi:MAG: hypothetical protein JW891_11870 [Candidatus Lokiarchaeota archaeon]|nr:hypothetical protein [Candidatus Lokiarchaeota archaeon]
MKLAEDSEVLVCFKNQNSFNRWIEKVERDVLKYEDKEEFLVNMLKCFEKIHWIRIIAEETLSFKIELLGEESKINFEYMFKCFLKYAKITESHGEFMLNKII